MKTISENTSTVIMSTSTVVDVHDIFKRITQSLVGGVPIVGGALSVSTGLLFDWLGGAPDPWVEFENKINRLITNKLNQSEARFVRNSLAGLDKNLNDYLVDFNKSVGQSGHSDRIKVFASRIGAISDSVERLLPHVLKPTSHHATAPYLEHFFLLSIAVNVIGESLASGTYNFSKRRQDLYKSIELYVVAAFSDAARERSSEIELKNFNTSSNKRVGSAVYDYSKNRKLSGTLFGWPTNVINATLDTIRAGAATVSLVDLYRYALQNLHTIAKNDITAGYDANAIPTVYERAVSNNYNSFITKWNAPVMQNMINSADMDSSIRMIANTKTNEFLTLTGQLPNSLLSKI